MDSRECWCDRALPQEVAFRAPAFCQSLEAFCQSLEASLDPRQMDHIHRCRWLRAFGGGEMRRHSVCDRRLVGNVEQIVPRSVRSRHCR